MQSFQLYERASTVPEKSYTRGDWRTGYESLKQEFDYWIDDVEGQIPPELQGTLFRNGPGLLDVNGQRIHHPFDGDGMISRITFSNGHAHFRNRFIRTAAYLEEQKAGKILYRGVFGTQKPGGWLANAFDFKLKNIANTNVIYWGGKLLALWEAADPHRLDPYTLETLGKEHFNSVLSEGEAFAAHPRFDPSCAADDGAPCMVNFSIKPGLSSTITIFDLDLTGKVVRKHAHSVPGFAFIHDFAITPNYCIFFQNSIAFNPIPFALGLRGAGECVKFLPNQPTRVIVIPRTPPRQSPTAGNPEVCPEGNQRQMPTEGNPPAALAPPCNFSPPAVLAPQPSPPARRESRGVQILETQSGFVFHHANAFEVGDEIVVDSICYESFPEVESGSDFREVDFDALKPGHLWRFHLNLKEKTVHGELTVDHCCEFPGVHPDHMGRPYRYLYIGAAHAQTGNSPLQALMKVDLESGERQLWSAAPRGFASEPVFVPRPGSEKEDDGWVLALVYNSEHHRSDVVILDANDFSKEPVARLHLKHHVPYGLHGSFTNEVFA